MHDHVTCFYGPNLQGPRHFFCKYNQPVNRIAKSLLYSLIRFHYLNMIFKFEDKNLDSIARPNLISKVNNSILQLEKY